MASAFVIRMPVQVIANMVTLMHVRSKATKYVKSPFCCEIEFHWFQFREYLPSIYKARCPLYARRAYYINTYGNVKSQRHRNRPFAWRIKISVGIFINVKFL